jgi:hypothetical protein
MHLLIVMVVSKYLVPRKSHELRIYFTGLSYDISLIKFDEIISIR